MQLEGERREARKLPAKGPRQNRTDDPRKGGKKSGTPGNVKPFPGTSKKKQDGGVQRRDNRGPSNAVQPSSWAWTQRGKVANLREQPDGDEQGKDGNLTGTPPSGCMRRTQGAKKSHGERKGPSIGKTQGPEPHYDEGCEELTKQTTGTGKGCSLYQFRRIISMGNAATMDKNTLYVRNRPG